MATSNNRPNKNTHWRPLNRPLSSSSSSSSSSCPPPGFYRPKSSSSTSKQQHTTRENWSFTNSVRHQIGAKSNDGSGLLCTLVPYLPQDDAVAAGLGVHEGAVDATLTQEVADLLNQELGKLLLMKYQDFWKTVTTDTTIQLAFDSYLQFRQRWFDMPAMATKGVRRMAGIVVGDLELSRRVFMVLYRLSSNHDPGSPVTDCISTKEHADAIRDKRLLDVTKLLDICAIYGHNNAELTGFLVNNAFRSQPLFKDDLADIIPPLLDTINILHQRLRSPMVDISYISNADMAKKELLEVIAFLTDVVVTLDTFIEAYPFGARILILAGNNRISDGQLLFTLAVMHDSMLPILCESISKLESFTGNMADLSSKRPLQRHDEILSNEQIQLKLLRSQLIKFVWHLLSICYLDENSQVKNISIDRGFPEENPETRGNALVHAVLGMESSHEGKYECQPSARLIRKIERKYKFMEAVSKLQRNGVIILDDAQIECISALVSDKTDSNLYSGRQEEAIISESKISHIKDLFPSYGSGFLAACLEVYDDNPEEVIQRILDDSLHPDLLLLDRTLETKPEKSVAVHNKGKEKVDDFSSMLPERKVGSSSSSNKMKKLVSEVTSQSVNTVTPKPAASSSASNSNERPNNLSQNRVSPLGRYIRKEKEGNATQLLDQRDEASLLHSVAMASQYEDEYDDSFDDLGTYIADDGIEEAESLVDVTSGSKVSVANNDWERNKPSPSKNAGSGDGTSDSRIKPWERNLFKKQTTNMHINTTDFQGMSKNRNRGSWKDASKTQYYVKDGKNYSYKVAGAVAVSSVEEAEAVRVREHDTIYGLGRGGNVPFKVRGNPVDNNFVEDESERVQEGRVFSQSDTRPKAEQHGRGRGRGMKDYDRYHKKDRAMKKHFTSIGGV